MAIFAWKDPKMAHYYVQNANKKRMALAAQRSMNWEEIENRISPHPGFGEGTSV